MTLHLFVRFETGAETETVGRALRECGPPSRAEPGCLEYRTFRSAEGDAIFLKEEWTGQAALDEHMATPHFLRFRSALETALGKPMEECGSIWTAEALE